MGGVENEERTLFRWTVDDPWTWEEMDTVWHEYVRMVDSVGHRVDGLIDLRHNHSAPPNALTMMQTRYATLTPNTGLIIMICAPAIIKALIAVMRRINPAVYNHYHFVATFDEAYDMLAFERVPHH